MKPLAEYLGVPHVIATRAKIEDGKYTGELDFYAYAEGKREAMVEEAERLADRPSRARTPTRTRSPTSRCSKSVGHPHAVNPDKELRKVAEEREWPILAVPEPDLAPATHRGAHAAACSRGRRAGRSDRHRG